MTFDTNLWDTSGGVMHSTSVNSTRFTAPTSGYYLFNCQVNLDGSNSGYLGTFIGKNGTPIYYGTQAVNGYSVSLASWVVNMAANDYLECSYITGSSQAVSAGITGTQAVFVKLF